jgi:hypothetical protein
VLRHLPCRSWLLLVAALFSSAEVARACPFCSAVSMTRSEEIRSGDAAVIARLARVLLPPVDADSPRIITPAESGRATFEIAEVLKGPPTLAPKKSIEVLYFGEQPIGTFFLIIGSDPKDLAWATPTPLTERSRKYVAQLLKLPETGAERLAFFQDYLEDPDPLMGADAYDEFAKAPYAEVSLLKNRMQHDKLLDWIRNPATATSRKRL